MRLVKNFWFVGPNWHFKKQVVDSLCRLHPEEMQAMKKNGPQILAQLLALLEKMGIQAGNLAHFNQPFPEPARERFGFLYAGTAIALQRQAGHEVEFFSVIVSEHQDWFRAIFAFDDMATAVDTWKIALFLLSVVIPGAKIQIKPFSAETDVAGVVSQYIALSKKRRIPADLRAITDAAERAGVPWVRNNQTGLDTSRRENQIRPNGGLLLGQAVHSHSVDGTFCTDLCQASIPLLENDFLMKLELESLGVAVPKNTHNAQPGFTLLHAIKGALKLGFPMAVKPCRTRHGQGVSTGVSSLKDLMAAIEKAQKTDKEFYVERHAKGQAYRVLVVNHEVVVVIEKTSGDNVTTQTHHSIFETSCAISQHLGVGMLVVTVVTPEVNKPMIEAGAVVVEVDIAPELDHFLLPGSEVFREAADRFIHWLFPPSVPARIPIIAVTGSNGKTTTCRMIARIAHQAGFDTGLSCSDGMYVNNRQVLNFADPDYAQRTHHLQLENRDINLSVMEFYFGRLKQQGHIFDWCNVAICTNVTPEHLQVGWETVEQIAEIKASILETARDGVVLNADDPHWRGMLNKVSAEKLCLTSQRYPISELRSHQLDGPAAGGSIGAAVSYCLAEQVNGQTRIVIHDAEKTLDVMAVTEIPATFDGKASFNIDNALQAVAACYLMKMDIAVIRATLSVFGMGFEDTPGRQNLFEELPFKVMMDYAHNADGIEKIGSLATQLAVQGRKILMFAIDPSRTDAELRDTVLAAVPHFDYFLCRNYPKAPPGGRPPEKALKMMQSTFLEAGVAPDRVRLLDDPADAVNQALGMGQAGDLLVLTVGTYEMEDMWSRIRAFGKP